MAAAATAPITHFLELDIAHSSTTAMQQRNTLTRMTRGKRMQANGTERAKPTAAQQPYSTQHGTGTVSKAANEPINEVNRPYSKDR